jgi:hypothetical protein
MARVDIKAAKHISAQTWVDGKLKELQAHHTKSLWLSL